MLTKQDYDLAYERELYMDYPAVEALETRLGYAIDEDRLLTAARVLACPVKVNPPCWQHGRVVYAVARSYIARSVLRDNGNKRGPVTFLDVGTAKGFSALCVRWAIEDSQIIARSVSVDVIDPMSSVRRNTVAEVDGYCSLYDVLRPWKESRHIEFVKCSGIEWLTNRNTDRVDFAFVDGKHTYEAVLAEGRLLATVQQAGDVVVFDDVQIDGVNNAVHVLSKKEYDVEYVDAKPDRKYAIATRSDR